MNRIEIAVLMGIITSIIALSITSFAQESSYVREGVVRLHVMANSNSDQDQDLKLAVRDAVLAESREVFGATSSKEQVWNLAEKHLETIRLAAQAEIDAAGAPYVASVRMVNMFFDTIDYGYLIMPAGYYSAVRVVIGEGEGVNWWCVMFPPMCIPAATQSDGSELYERISDLSERPQYRAKFAIGELIQAVRGRSDIQ